MPLSPDDALDRASPLHALLGARVIHQLCLQLQGSCCQVYSSDLGVRCLATGLATYADVTVVCGRVELDPEDADTVVNPALLVEVTSPTSEQRDRGSKLEHYKTIPSLMTIVVVSHREPRIEVHERLVGLDGVPCDLWTVRVATSRPVPLPALNYDDDIEVELDLVELYAGTEL